MSTKLLLKKRVTVAIGTRHEAIKMAPLIHKLKQVNELDIKLCITGQHKFLLNQALEVFDLEPDIDFNLMKENQNLHETFANILTAFKIHLDDYQPDLVIVHGDTATASAVALSCFFNGTKVIHIEAGLRTWDLKSPFPEEFNRQLISKIASYHFAPTSGNAENLRKDHVPDETVFITGNTVVDALDLVQLKLSTLSPETVDILESLNRDLKFDITKHKFILITAHRRENFGSKMIEICESIKQLAQDYPELNFVFPVHPNPNVQSITSSILANVDNIILATPRNYLEFIALLKHCVLVLSDSGGLQEEAPSFGKPLILLRDTTERPEAISSGCAYLVSPNRFDIVDTFNMVFGLVESGKFTPEQVNPFGDGNSASRIKETIINILKQV